MAPSRRRNKRSATQTAPQPETLSAEVECKAVLPPDYSGKKKGKQAPTTRALTARSLHRAGIWTIDDFLSAAECRAWIAYAHECGFTEAVHEATWETAFRSNGRVEVRCAATAEAIWQRLSKLLPDGLAPGQKAGGCFDKIRLYRYTAGQRFGKHVDVSDVAGPGTVTGATVLIYLNGEEDTGSIVNGEVAGVAGATGENLQGGETVFYEGRRDDQVALSFKPKRGSLLVHAHGDRCLTHEAMEVTHGAKYVLRTDVTYI